MDLTLTGAYSLVSRRYIHVCCSAMIDRLCSTRWLDEFLLSVGETVRFFCSFAMAVQCQERSLSEDIVNSSNNKETIVIEEIVRAGPRGAIALAGTSTAIVIGLWFLFYFLVFLPRGVIQ